MFLESYPDGKSSLSLGMTRLELRAASNAPPLLKRSVA